LRTWNIGQGKEPKRKGARRSWEIGAFLPPSETPMENNEFEEAI
jgi:hypothetical protein